MRTKLLSALLLASTAITGIASASPYVRDHRYQRPAPAYKTVYRPAPGQSSARWNDSWRGGWSGGVHVTTRPTWMPQVDYGFQLTAGNSVEPYAYGQDPYVEDIARGEWMTLNPCIEVNGHYAERTALSRPLQSIEYQATSGSAFVQTVGVIFDDGSQRAFIVNRELDAHEPNLRIDLGAEGLKGIEAVVFDARGNANVRMIGA